MLDLIQPSIKELVEAGVKVYWIGIPTIPSNDGNRKKLRKEGEFAYYSSKNSIAKKAVESVGAVFIDIAAVTQSRREADDLITTDGYHWCNPGPTAITAFINQAVFHLIAIDIQRHKN